MGYPGNWGWIDKQGNEVVPCQYLFASELGDEIIVAKGDYKTMEDDEDTMQKYSVSCYGVVDIYGNEIVPCIFNALKKIKRINTNRNCYLCWMNDSHDPKYEWGHVCIYDADNKKILADADIEHDGREWYSSEVMNDEYVYIHDPGMISIYSFISNRWECVNKKYILEEGRE